MRRRARREHSLSVDAFASCSEHECLVTDWKRDLIGTLVTKIHLYVPVAYTCHFGGVHPFGVEVPRLITLVPSPKVCRISILFRDDSFHDVGFLFMIGV